MIRLVLFVGALLGAVLWLEPTVVREERVLIIRLRTADELIGAARTGSRMLGARLAERLRPSEPPSVGAPGIRASSEDLTPEDRDRLDRLVETVTEDR